MTRKLPKLNSQTNTHIHSLISEDQTGFMANRYIGDNIRLIYDLISYLNKEICLGYSSA